MINFENENINLENLSLYLRRNNWMGESANYKGLKIFYKIFGTDEVEIILPATDEISNKNDLLSNAIVTISALEQKEPEIIIKSIKAVDTDFHYIRIPTKNDSVPISVAEQIINSYQKLFSLSARKEAKNQPKIKDKKQDYNIANDYINTCRFAHTWKGSFGFTLEAPVNIPTVGIFEEVPETPERKISKRVFTGMMLIQEAGIKKSENIIIDNVEKGFDGSMCYQVVEIFDKLREKSFEYNTVWAPAIQIDRDISEIKTIKMDGSSYLYAERAVSKLKFDEDSYSIWFQGFPEGFRSPKESFIHEELRDRSISVKGFSKETDKATLRLDDLDIIYYRKALKAHQEKKNVLINCTVRKKFRRWEVKEIYSLEILDNTFKETTLK